MTTPTIPQRQTTENTLHRALLRRLQALTPEGTPAATLLESARPLFDPTSEPPSATVAPVEDDPPEDPITAALRHDPRAADLARQQRELATVLRHSVSAEAWRTFLAHESTTNAHTSVLESIVFDHAFRLGQLYPALPRTEEAVRNPVLHRLARAATDLRTPPGQRLRVLLAAAIQALEELYPVPG